MQSMPILLAAVCLVASAAASAPPAVNIGGLFSIFDSDGNPDNEAIQLQAAFLMAVEDLNNKSDGVFDDVLPDTQLKFAVRGSSKRHANVASALELLESVDIGGDVGVHALINGLQSDSHTGAMNAFISESTADFSSSMVQGTIERYYDVTHSVAIEVTPLPVNQGRVLQDILCNRFEYRKIGIFYSTNSFGIETLNRFLNEEYCTFEVYLELAIEDFHVDDVLATVPEEAYDARVFVVLSDEPTSAGHLLESAYTKGLFRLGSQVFLTDEAMDVAGLKEGMRLSSDDQKTRILHGLFGVRFWPSYWFHNSALGEAFHERWVARASTAGAPGGPCDTTQDDSNGQYLYQNDAGTVCAGLDYSSFASVRDITPMAAFVYDAVVLAAIGLHHLLVTEALPLSSSSGVYHDAVINGTHAREPFAGVSGNIHLSDEGIRSNFMQYALQNFHDDEYALSPTSNDAFVVVGNWSANKGYHDCDESADSACHSFEYNSLGNGIPHDHPPHYHDEPPEVIKLAAYFKPLDDNGAPDPFMVQHLAAFLMAVREINNKSDGIADDLLPNTELVFVLKSPSGLIGAELAVHETLMEDFSSTGIQAAFSALDSATTISLNTKYGVESVLTMHSAATASEFGSGADFPMKVQTVYIDTFQGMAWQHVFCNYLKYTHVTVIASGDYFGRMATIENSDDTYCHVTHLEVLDAYRGATDIDAIIAAAKYSGSNVFLFFMSAEYVDIAAEILAAGWRAGLFREGTQIIGSEQMTIPLLFNYLEDDGVDVAAMMKGYMAMRVDANYHLRHSDGGKNFIQRWKSQPATQWSTGEGTAACDQSRDGPDISYLFRDGVSVLGDHTCFGLNFSAFADDGSDMAKFLANTYDGVYALAYGFHELIANGDDVTGINLHDAVIDTVDFQGASGHVDIFEGMGIYSNYAHGDREVGNVFSIMNFDAAKYATNGPNGDVMTEVFLWTVEDGITEIREPVYNTKGNTPPEDQNEDIMVEMTSIQKDVVMAFGILCVLWSFALLVFLIVFREAKVVKAAQAKMSLLVVSGGILAGGRVINAAMAITDATCTAGLWLGHIGFFLVFGTLLVKTWRIHRLLLAGLKKVKISETYVLCMMGAGLGFLVVYLALLTAVGRPQESANCTLESNQETCLKFCSFEHTEFHTVLFALEAAVLIYGAYLCYGTKGAPDSINEAKFIALAMTLICVVSALVFPLVFLIELDPADRQLIASVSIAAVCMMSLGIMFWPKVLAVAEGQDLNWTKVKAAASSYASKLSSTSDHDTKAKASKSQVVPVDSPAGSKNSSINNLTGASVSLALQDAAAALNTCPSVQEAAQEEESPQHMIDQQDHEGEFVKNFEAPASSAKL